MLNFCTLFNTTYLSRGLAMYESLVKHCPNFHLYVFAFDDYVYEFFKAQNYPHLTVISLAEFEDEELLKVKPTRSAGEYCWTCTPSTIKYCIDTYQLDHCTYVDADLYFFANPQVLIEEVPAHKSVMITEHRYTKKYLPSIINGKYCVQFMHFKNDIKGMEVLHWWRNACNEWCYAKLEDGKFGDQKYLDEWTTKFQCVYELQHLGGGVAPWNVQQYQVAETANNQIILQEIKTQKNFSLVFYHFHGLKYFKGAQVDIGRGYSYSKQIIKTIYEPYVQALDIWEKECLNFRPILPREECQLQYNLTGLQLFLKRKIKGEYYQLYKLKKLLRLDHDGNTFNPKNTQR